MRIGSALLGAGFLFLPFIGLPGEAAAAISWDLSLGGGALWDDNLHLDPGPGIEGRRAPVEETIYAGAADLGLDWIGRRDSLRGSYRGEYWTFSGDEELDPLWLHAITADLSWRRWSPFFLEAREQRDRVPRSQEREGVAAVDQIDRNRVFGRTGLSWQFGGRGAVELAYRGEVEAFTGVEEADKIQRQFGEGLARYRWSPLVEAELRVAYGRVERRRAVDYAEASVAAEVAQRLSERLRLSYGLEWLRDDEDAPHAVEGQPAERRSGVRTSLLKTAELRWEAPGQGSRWLRYTETLEAQPDGDTLRAGRAAAGVLLRARLGSTLEIGGWYEERDHRVSGREDTAWGPTLHARWMVAPWAACDLGGAWTSTTVREAGLPEVQDGRAEVSAGVTLVAARHLALEVGYRFRENDSEDPLRSYQGNQLFTWLTYHLRPLLPGHVPAASATTASAR